MSNMGLRASASDLEGLWAAAGQVERCTASICKETS